MSPKLASAMVCIGIAVGCLSAPKSSSSGAKPRHAISPTVQPSIVQSDLGAVAESLEFSTSALPPALPGTNTFGVAIER